MKDWLDLGRLNQTIKVLGPKKIAAGGVSLLVMAALIVGGGYFVSRPDYETIYVGLNQADVARIGSVLKDAAITFDVSLDGTKVGVARGQGARARALLAQRGLPGTSGGYELFDKMGASGLTTFMQEVTRSRALEGEIARTIQTLRGVISARVHIVMPESGTFRRPPQQPSASIVIKTEVGNDISAVPAIRHIVAAAVPGLSSDSVRVLSADGAVLAGDASESANSPNRLLDLQKSVGAGLQDNIRRTLTPYLGMENFEVSVAVRLNADRQQINETSFDPERKVERSTRVVREVGNAQNTGTRQNVSVEQNIPVEQTLPQGGDQSKKSTQKRDEVTNFEVPSKSTATTTVGYRLEQITVAVVINRKRLTSLLGTTASPDAIAKQVSEIERLVSSSGGLIESRGDRVSVAALDFAADARSEEPSGFSISQMLSSHMSAAIKSLAFIVVAVLQLQFGMKPLSRALAELPSPPSAAPQIAGTLASQSAGLAGGPGAAPQVPEAADPASRLIEAIDARRGTRPSDRLNQMVDLDREQALTILRRWLHEDERT